MTDKEHQHKPKHAKNIIIGVLLITIVILVFAFLNGGDAEPNNEQPTITDSRPGDAMEEPRDAKSFEYLLPEQWEHLERAEEAIQELAPGQRVQFGILEDPINPDIVYFTSSAFDVNKQENLLSVYKYNTSDFSWERLFRNTYGEGEFSGLADFVIPAFHIVGYDNNHLVVLVQDTDDSPGPCADPLLIGFSEPAFDEDDNPVLIRDLLSMSISEPYSGFRDYTPPDEVIEEAQERQEECLENLQ